MKHYYCAVGMDYNGEELRPLFNYQTFGSKGDQGDSISAFIGKMNVTTEHLVDMEDVIANDFIWSPEAINFVVEIFHIGIESAVLYQRSLMFIIFSYLLNKMYLKNLNANIENIKLNGDDLMVKVCGEYKKLSVSIATVSPMSGLIHAGLNIKIDDHIPVPAIGLDSIFSPPEVGPPEVYTPAGATEFNLNETSALIKHVLNTFSDYVKSIKNATTKVRSVI